MWKIVKGLSQIHTDGDLQDFLFVDEEVSSHKRVSKDGIIEGILRTSGGEEDESVNKDNEAEVGKVEEKEKKIPFVHLLKSL